MKISKINQLIRILSIFNTISYLYIYIDVINNIEVKIMNGKFDFYFLGIVLFSSLINLLIFLLCFFFYRPLDLKMNLEDAFKFILLNIVSFSVYIYWGLGYDPN